MTHARELANFGGREGRVVLPAVPPAAFVSTLRREASGAIVLGGPRVEVKRGLISAAEAAAAGVGGGGGSGRRREPEPGREPGRGPGGG